MHVRVRMFGKPETIIVVDSKLTKIERFREIIKEKFDVHPNVQRLFYGGKLLEDGYNLHDYNIKLNDVIQLVVKSVPKEDTTNNNKKTPVKEDTKKLTFCFNETEIVYKDACSTLYQVGDLVDVKDLDYGAWFEGEIVRIVLDPKLDYETEEDLNNKDKSNVSPPKPLSEKKLSNNNSITQYFPNLQKGSLKKERVKIQDDNILYKVLVDYDKIDFMVMYCNLNAIRPRARTEIDYDDLEVGQRVMLNYDIESPTDVGFWYDFKIDKIKKPSRNGKTLIGTLYVAYDSAPLKNTRIDVLDKIYAIEKPVPLAERTKEYKKLMKVKPEIRTKPPSCFYCYDDPDITCKECGCYECSLKTSPSKIVLCDECNRGYHTNCLSPPMTEIPEDDWYCPLCKRDPNEVIAPGCSKQPKKTTSNTKRDWGRGMACASKTKTCAMPPNHFGPIPGIEVGMCWRFRIQLSESGVHRPPVSGIHGRDSEGAYSIVLSGGYEDDVDHGEEFTYTGSGGRDLSGNKRTAEQSCDQKLTRENKALARNCAVKEVSEDGGDAGKKWKEGKPVRVVRSYKMLKHFPKYAPKEGIRYDGIYKVVKYYPETGLSGYRVWKYLLRRDDPSPAPWEKGAKIFPIVYPDGYLEAEAEKKAQKGKGTKKKLAADSEASSSNSDNTPPPSKKRKLKKNDKSGTPKEAKNSKKAVPSMFTKNKIKEEKEIVLNEYEKTVIESDTMNTKLWAECLEVAEKQSKKEFIEHVTKVFLCIICQDLVVNPFTTPCLHNFCMACIKHAFKSTESKKCPCCRHSLEDVELVHNENLKTALRNILPGYDAGKN